LNIEECNPGATLVDITTFISVQKLLDNPADAKDFQILDLCSLMDALVLSNRILFIEPIPAFRQMIKPYPSLLKELSAKCHNLEFLPCPKDSNIAESVLTLAKEIKSNKKEKEFLTQYSEELDISGYYRRIGPTFLDQSTLKLLENMGFPITSGAFYGLGHVYRANQYLKTSVEKGIPYYPHYIREPIFAFLLKKASRMALIAKKYVSRLEIAEKERREYLNNLKGGTIYDLDFPAIPTYISSRCKTPADIIDETIKVVREPGTQKFRDYMEQLERALLMGAQGRKEFNKYENRVEDYIDSLEIKKRSQGYKLHSIVSVGIEDVINPTTSLPVKNVVPIFEKLTDSLYKRFLRRQLTFLGALTKNVREITSSKETFEKLFRKKLDASAFETLRERI
jgi:hypothetical protein